MGQLNERRHSLLVVEDCRTFGDKIHFVKLLAVGDDGLARLVDSAIHTHDQLVLETGVGIQEKVVEMDLERLEERLRNLILN